MAGREVARRCWATGALIVVVALLFAAGCAAPVTPPATAEPASADVLPAATPPQALPTVAPPPPTAIPDGVAAAGEVGPGGPADAPGASVPAVAPTALPTPPPAPTEPAGPRQRVVVLDPGHGGQESGAAAHGLVEKHLNLKTALKLADLLRAEGYEVVLTRDTDRTVSPLYTGSGYAGGLRYDVQARVDIANAANADLFISLHYNGSPDPTQSGTEVWYNKQRTFADRNLALAQLTQEALLKHIRALGYPVVDRGIKDDSNFRVFRGRSYNIYVLGPGDGPRQHVPTMMPAILGEPLIISNPGDAAMLRQERTLDAIAAGYRDAIVAYFARYPD